MAKRLFAVASASFLLTVVIGASTTTSGCSPNAVGSGFPVDAGRDVQRTIGDNEEATAQTCMTSQLLDATSVAYKPALIEPGACTEDAITLIKNLSSQNQNLTLADMKAALQKQSATCAACVFAPDGDHWAPIVESNGQSFLNLGGCMEIVSGNVACGKAWYQFDACTNYGCQNCTTQADQDQCFQDIIAQGAPCADAATSLRSSCGTNLTSYLDTCFPQNDITIAGPIRYQCIKGSSGDGGAPADAGHD